MPRPSPYQPVLLRILHGAAAVLIILALVSGFWVYNTYDQRWGGIVLPQPEDIQGIHGTIALTFLLFLPFFALYSFHLGYRRLLQEQSFHHLKQFDKPIWWITIHHLTNTLMLLSATFAVVTGRMMKEEWLPAGEVDQKWYLAHLLAWLLMLLSLALHLLLGAKVGGLHLLASMFNSRIHQADTPDSWLKGMRINTSSLNLKIIEVVVIGGIIMAFILPAFNL